VAKRIIEPTRRSNRGTPIPEGGDAILDGFKEFLSKSNALALAIGVIIGASLGTVVTTLVDAVIMPPIGFALNGVDFATIRTVLGRDPAGKEISIGWGLLINSLIVFLVVMLVVYVISKLFIREAPPAGPSAEETLLTEIRDELRRRPS
jgi:large conductance mechanosensitive channel